MAETAEQYTGRLLGYQGQKDPLAVLQATPAILAQAAAGTDEAHLRRRPSPTQWSVAEILVHLSETEMVIGYRVRVILGASGGPIQAFDQDKWAERYDRMSVATALAMQRGLREGNLALYRSLTPEEWQRFGIHSERGKETVERVVRLAAGHDLNHIQQIAAIRAA